MADPATSNLEQKAVLWEFIGYDSHGESKVSDIPVEIDCAWTDKKSEILDSKGNTVIIDASAFIAQKIKIGSNMWLGKLKDIPVDSDGPDQPQTEGLEIMQVIAYNETPNIKRRNPAREVKLIRYRDTVPETA